VRAAEKAERGQGQVLTHIRRALLHGNLDAWYLIGFTTALIKECQY